MLLDVPRIMKKRVVSGGGWVTSLERRSYRHCRFNNRSSYHNANQRGRNWQDNQFYKHRSSNVDPVWQEYRRGRKLVGRGTTLVVQLPRLPEFTLCTQGRHVEERDPVLASGAGSCDGKGSSPVGESIWRGLVHAAKTRIARKPAVSVTLPKIENTISG